MFHVNVFGFSPMASSSATGLLWNLLFREPSNTSVITFENVKEPEDVLVLYSVYSGCLVG